LTDTPESPEPTEDVAAFTAGLAALLDGQLPEAPTEPTPAIDGETEGGSETTATEEPPEGTPGGRFSRDEATKAWRIVNQLELAAALPLYLVRGMAHALAAEETNTDAPYSEAQRSELRETRALMAAIITKRMAYGDS
jgi:hypothetical protein